MNYIDRFDELTLIRCMCVWCTHIHLIRVSPLNYIIHCRISYAATFTKILS